MLHYTPIQDDILNNLLFFFLFLKHWNIFVYIDTEPQGKKGDVHGMNISNRILYLLKMTLKNI